MPEFHFKLDTLLRQRQALERQAQHALARAQSEVLKLQAQLAQAQDQLRNLPRDAASPDHQRFMAAMTAKSATLRRQLAKFEGERSTAHATFAAAAKDHQAIQLLRDKALAEWRKQQAAAEQNALDEAAREGPASIIPPDMPYRAVLFDLDGTLLNTLEDLAACANRVLAQRAFPQHPVHAYRYFIGDGVRTLIERILPENRRDAEMITSCIDAYRKDYAGNWNVKTFVYDGISETLDELVNQNIKLAVLSNKPHEFTMLCVEKYLARWRFDAVLGQSEDRPKKPDPAGAIEIARRLELPPQDVLYVGDTATDMQTAVAAGMFPVGALWGFRTREELTKSGARAVIVHPRELLPLID